MPKGHKTKRWPLEDWNADDDALSLVGGYEPVYSKRTCLIVTMKLGQTEIFKQMAMCSAKDA